MLWGQKRLGKLVSALRISHKRGNHTTELGPKKSMSVGSTERDNMTSSLIPFHLLLLHLSPTYGSGWCLSHCSGFPGVNNRFRKLRTKDIKTLRITLYKTFKDIKLQRSTHNKIFMNKNTNLKMIGF